MASTMPAERLSAISYQPPAFRLSPFAFILSLLLLAALIRLPGLARPLLGNFATKNVVYAMIARNWALGRAELSRPTVDLLAEGQRAWHLVEWPASAYVTGALWKVCGGSLDAWGRGTSVAWSLLAVAWLYWLVRRWHGETAARGAAAVYALSPVSLIYGQSFMLEASVGCLSIAAFCGVQRWLDSRRGIWLAAAAGCLALLFLTKIYMLVILLPLFALVWRAEKLSAFSFQLSAFRLSPFAFLLLASLPAILWYANTWHIAAPSRESAARVYYSIRHSAGVHGFPSPLLAQLAFYRKLLSDLAGVALTPVGLLLAAAGFWHREGRRHAAWLASVAVLVAALPLKFMEMNYYQLVILPPLAVMAGLGWGKIQESWRLGRWAVAGLLLLGLLFTARYAARPAFATPAEDRGVLAAAAALQRHAPAGEPIVTLHGSTIDLLYYCDHPGWALSPDDPDLPAQLAACQKQGARYLVVCGPQEQIDRVSQLEALSGGTLLEATDEYRVYPLD
ncbi:MAG: hypothetical protein AB7O62_10140 [Pirellulales bacterium]